MTIKLNNGSTELVKCDTNNATRIGWESMCENNYWSRDYRMLQKKAYYRHLDRHNSGRQNGSVWQNNEYNTYELNRNLIQCMKSKLRLKQWETKRSIQWFDALQRSNLGIKSKVVALSTCAYVLHNFNNHRSSCHPQTEPSDRDAFLEDCREDFGISNDWFSSVYGKVSHRIRNDKLDVQRRDYFGLKADQGWQSRRKGGGGI